MRARRGMVAVALLPAAAVALTGCTKTVKASDAEAKIQRNLESQMPTRTVTVDCPGGKKAQKGTTFSCAVRIDGEASVADVRLVSDDRITFRVHSR